VTIFETPITRHRFHNAIIIRKHRYIRLIPGKQRSLIGLALSRLVFTRFIPSKQTPPVVPQESHLPINTRSRDLNPRFYLRPVFKSDPCYATKTKLSG